MDEEIVILGNGFDLSCELKSSYRNFFNKRYYGVYDKRTKHDFTNIGARCSDIVSEPFNFGGASTSKKQFEGINFWDLAVFKKDGAFGTWQDFEGFIKSTLKTIDKSLDELKKKYRTGPLSKIDLIDFIDITQKIEGDNTLLPFIYMTMQFDQEVFSRTLTKENVSDFLLEELIKFERTFCDYMTEEVSNSRYNYESEKLLKTIQSGKEYGIDSYVVTFNYTNPVHRNAYLTNNSEDGFLNHVHGDLYNRDIIFGINISDVSLNKKEFKHSYFNVPFFRKFTKTYRTLSLKNKYSLFRKKTKEIKFFGHSLGEADFSYFKVMFDSLNLYEGDLKLKFYYKNYQKGLDAKSQQIVLVTNLLKQYEEGLEDEGNVNIPYSGYIFDKLRTEGRLSIINVEPI